MGKFLAIAHNTFVQSLRQPVTCILVLVAILAMPFLLGSSNWSMGEGEGNYHDTDQKMLQDLGLSTLLFLGGLLAVFSASSALTREIEDRTALTVISKPVPRPVFLLGKFAGVSAAVALAYGIGAAAFLMAVRHGVVSAASEPFDWPVIVLGFSALGLSLLAAAGGNFFFGWPFTSALIWCQVVCLTLALGAILFIGKGWTLVPPGYDAPPKRYDVIRARLGDLKDKPAFEAQAKKQEFVILRWEFRQPVVYVQPRIPSSGFYTAETIQRGIAEVRQWREEGVVEVGRQIDPPVIRSDLLAGMGLNFLSLLVLVAVAVTASTRLGLVLTLLVCLGVGALGALHPYLAHQGGGNRAVLVLGWLLPNLTYFYSMDVLSRPFETAIPAKFLGLAALYCLLYVGGILALGMALFQRRQMAAEGSGASVPGGVHLLAGIGRAAALLLLLAGLIFLANPAMHNAWGLLTVAIALALGAASWFLWGYFGHGAKWAYYLVLVVTAVVLGLWIAGTFWPAARRVLLWRHEDAVARGLSALVAGATLLILLLPKTRRHFQSHR